MRSRANAGRALFLTRDSGGRHETTPGQYVEWAARTARELGLTFRGTSEQIVRMIKDGIAVDGDIFQDYGISGEKLSRRGLDAWVEEALRDLQVSHVMAPRRDRLARPEDPLDAIRIETRLREAGITIIFMDKTLPPIQRGAKRNVAETITSFIDYSASSDFVIDLAQKMIYAQITLARHGYSTGGRAPFGFRRWLVSEDGQRVRQLRDAEHVKIPGHHVVWLPGPDEEIALACRIREMLETMPACRVAAILTQEGVPPPDAGRMRTDRGVKHKTSGIWHQPTIINIGRNPLFAAIVVYGHRSMGRLLRFTPDGPRPLSDSEYLDEGKKKVVRNDVSKLITAPARFKPLVEPDQHRKLVAILDARAGSQRGKPRSRNPGQNPLGSRVFDMECSWPMYRVPTNSGFCYLCGLYQQTHGQKCSHNWLDGTLATKFVVNSIRQRVFAAGALPRIKERLHKFAEQETADKGDSATIKTAEAQFADLNAKRERVARNMALAENEEQYRAMQKVFESLRSDEQRLQTQLSDLRGKTSTSADPVKEVQKALHVLDDLGAVLSDPACMTKAGDLVQQFNARLFLRFEHVKQAKRVTHKLASGILTLGNAPLPIQPYQGPTARKALLVPADDKIQDAPTGGASRSSGKVELLGNVNRGDWI